MTGRHSRMSSDADRERDRDRDRDTSTAAAATSTSFMTPALSRATPIMPLGMPMTREAKESREQAQAWDASLNRIFQAMQGEDTAKYLAYFKARLEIEEAYTRGLEKLIASAKGSSRNTGANNNNNNNNNNGNNTQGTGQAGAGAGAGTGQGSSINGGNGDPDEIPTTLHMAYNSLLETTQQLCKRRQPFVKLLKNVMGALATLKESHEKQRKGHKEAARPVFQLYAETRLSTVPKLKRAYEQRCRDVEQVLAMEDSDHLPVRERLKNLASSTGAAGRLVKSRRDLEEADNEYKTAVQQLEAFRVQRERYFDSSFQSMQNMVRERGMKCQECLKAYVTEERRLMEGAKEDMNRFSVMVDCIKPAGDTEQISLTFTKDINSHPKPVYYENYYQKAPPEGVFGLSLTEYVRKYRHPIPLVIVKCSEAIDRVGLRREGIYRVSGRHAQIMNLKKQFEANENAVDLTDAVSEDCASIAAVLKIYLRELPEPLFPFPLNERIGYSGIMDKNARLGELKGRLKRLPDCNIDTLQFLIRHLRRIYEHVEDNKMTLDNLCLIFTPAIFHDFNSAMVPGPQAAGGINQQPGDLSLTSLSFAPATTAGSPGTQTAPWSGYPSDQQNLQQQTQSYHPPPQYSPHGSSPSSPKAISDAPPGYPPVTGTHNGGTSDNKNKGSATGGATAVSQPQPSAAGTITSPLLSTAQPAQTTQISAATSNSTTTATTTPSFQPPTNTVSTAASWSNDMVLSDLIINSDTIFNVLPKLPSRTNSGMSSLSLEDQQRLSVATSASTYSLPRPYDGSRKLSSANLDRNTNLASPTEGGGGGAGRQLMPRLDSLAASTTTSHPRTSPLPSPNTMEHSSYPYQPPPPPPPQHQYQQQQQQSYHPPPHMPPQYHQNNDGWQGNTGRTNSPPSPSSLKADQMAAVGPTRSRSNQDLQQSSQQQQQQ